MWKFIINKNIGTAIFLKKKFEFGMSEFQADLQYDTAMMTTMPSTALKNHFGTTFSYL
jgi:hypothetical protein